MLVSVFNALCFYANTPYACASLQRFRNGEIEELIKTAPDPFFYTWNNRHHEFELDYQVHSFLKKFQDFDLGINREKAAFDKWLAAEESCRKVNQDFRSRWVGASQRAHRVEEVLYLARRKITEILGTVRPCDLDLLRAKCRHGPGSDVSLGKRDASPYEKFRSRGAITRTCIELYDDVFGSTEDGDVRQERAHEALVVGTSKLSFTGKTALVDRGICTGARWNVFLQLGIGSLIQSRLRRFGVDITSQLRNQEMARRAHKSGLATVDLSSASDTVATNLVVDLLAECDEFWLDLLLKSRETTTEYKGVKYRLEKISSMGNGYTFPLETLIFYAFAHAAATFEGCDTADVTAYGDDIIVPQKCYSLLVESLGAFGFSVNTDKSYASGDFFESCGTDFMRGKEVRPVFLKERVTNLGQAYVLHNQLVEWSTRGMLPGEYRKSRLDLCKLVLDHIPRHARRYGPTTLSGVLHGPQAAWTTRALRENPSWEGLEVKAFASSFGDVSRYSYRGHLHSKLSSDLDCGNSVLDRGVVQFRDVWSVVPHRQTFFVVDDVA